MAKPYVMVGKSIGIRIPIRMISFNNLWMLVQFTAYAKTKAKLVVMNAVRVDI